MEYIIEGKFYDIEKIYTNDIHILTYNFITKLKPKDNIKLQKYYKFANIYANNKYFGSVYDNDIMLKLDRYLELVNVVTKQYYNDNK